MPTIQHPDIRPVSGDPTAGPHVIHFWEVADNTARDALTLVANDIGRVCRVGSAAPYAFFVLTDNTGPAWAALSGGSGAGDVVGPASATDNAVARFDSTTGKLIQASALIVDDSGNVSTIGTLASGALTVTGSIAVSSTVDGRDIATDGTKLDGIEALADVTDAANVAAAGAVMSGASAGSDIAGTYPSSITVTQARGLRETAGPTTLAVGSVADGQYLRRVGASIVGAAISGAGDVVGPASATANAVARFDGTTGKLIQDSTLIVDGSGNVTVSGTVDGRDVAADGTKLDGVESGADVTDATNVAAAGAVMSGASASGDLAGTYPAPTVTQARGLRESAGNTLAMGAVSDGEYLRRVGTSIVGATVSGAGDVTGPASAVDNALPRYDTTTGKLIQSSAITLSDATTVGDTTELLAITGVAISIKGGLGSSGGPAGGVAIDAGAPDSFSRSPVTIGATDASAVTIGRTGIQTTVLGDLEADMLFSRRRQAIWCDDFVNGMTGSSFSSLSAGAGSGVLATNTEANTFGVITCNTGAALGGRAGVFNASGANSMRTDSGAVWFDAHVRVPTLSDGSETFAVYIGLGNAQNAEPTQGIYFAYQSGTSDNWLIKCANASRTSEDSGIVVTTTWQRLQWRLSADGTSVRFFVGGVEAAGSPITTNLPNPADARSVTAFIMKSAGTLTRSLLVDYMATQVFFTTER